MKIEELSVEAIEPYERNPRKNEGAVNVYLHSTMVKLKASVSESVCLSSTYLHSIMVRLKLCQGLGNYYWNS